MENISLSEKYYNLSYSLYQTIANNLFLIENEKPNNINFLIEETLAEVKKLNNSVNKVNLFDLQQLYDDKTCSALQVNIELFKELVFTTNNTLNSILIYNNLYTNLVKYSKYNNLDLIAGKEEVAIKRICNFLSKPDNYSIYKLQVNNIIKNTLKQKDFDKLFNTIVTKIGKITKINPVENVSLIPPEMWVNSENSEWNKSILHNIEVANKEKCNESILMEF